MAYQTVKKLSDLVPELPNVEKATVYKTDGPVRVLNTPVVNEYILDDVKKSQNLIDVETQLGLHQQKAPIMQESAFNNQLNAITNSILNREPFTYDFNADPIYQQYKDQYTTLGEMAMRDTMGNAATLTGGYGNSYASTAGNQAYQAYLQQLNNIIPELQQNAYARDQDELAELYRQAGLLQGLVDADYAKQRDAKADWMAMLGYLTDQYNTLLDREYNAAIDQREWEHMLQQEALKGSGGGGGYYSVTPSDGGRSAGFDSVRAALLTQSKSANGGPNDADGDVDNTTVGNTHSAYSLINAAVRDGRITYDEGRELANEFGINVEAEIEWREARGLTT